MQRQRTVSVSRSSGDDGLLDQFVEHRILDAAQIARTRNLGRLGPELVAHGGARRQAEAKPQRHDVEIELIGALLVLRRIDDPDVGRDPEELQVADERQRVRLERRDRSREIRSRMAIRRAAPGPARSACSRPPCRRSSPLREAARGPTPNRRSPAAAAPGRTRPACSLSRNGSRNFISSGEGDPASPPSANSGKRTSCAGRRRT